MQHPYAFLGLKLGTADGPSVHKCSTTLPHGDFAGASMWSVPQVAVDAPKVLWTFDFQFDSTIDRTAIKMASLLDEHTRESLLDIVERSITADRLIEELHTCFATASWPPPMLRMVNGPELIFQALQSFWAGQVTESFNNRLGRKCLNRNHWTNLTEAVWSSATSSTLTTPWPATSTRSV